jgi:2',3'-cyclic-nucleotide 2'-phosphodiesterase (5'-nucleotidase family)
LNADIAVVAGANVRIDIPAGNLTPANVYALLPFENPLVVMKLTGKEVKAGLESDLRISATFPYVAGIRYTANKTKPEGSRLVSVEIKEKSGKWSALKDDTVYTVIADHVLSSSTGQVHETGLVDTKVFIEYAQHVGTLSRLKDTGITYITKP